MQANGFAADTTAYNADCSSRQLPTRAITKATYSLNGWD